MFTEPRYAYVGGSPSYGVDPTGRAAIDYAILATYACGWAGIIAGVYTEPLLNAGRGCVYIGAIPLGFPGAGLYAWGGLIATIIGAGDFAINIM